MVFFFFFKQKTAYEMRISDWSSDVCSSDLQINGQENSGQQPEEHKARRRVVSPSSGCDHPKDAYAAPKHRRERRERTVEAVDRRDEPEQHRHRELAAVRQTNPRERDAVGEGKRGPVRIKRVGCAETA